MRMTYDEMQRQASLEYGGPALGAWPLFKGQKLRPHKGGGGGDVAAESRAQEDERQARIKAATDQINSIFNGSGRDSMYADQRNTVYNLNAKEVERQAAEAERANRFGLARAGQLGGALDVDSNADLQRRTNEGLLRAGGIADAASADLRQQDESTRSNLISMAQSGIDTGSAASMALNGLKANAESAAGARGGATVGSLFNDISNAYLYNQQAKGANAGTTGTGSQWYGVSSPATKYAGS